MLSWTVLPKTHKVIIGAVPEYWHSIGILLLGLLHWAVPSILSTTTLSIGSLVFSFLLLAFRHYAHFILINVDPVISKLKLF
jgi:hypothetical protein